MIITTRKHLYKIMSNFSDDIAYQDILWHTYKYSIQMDICNFAPILAIPLFLIITCIGIYNKIWFIPIISTAIYVIFGIYTSNLNPVIDKNTIGYLNAVMKKNSKIIEDNHACLLKDDNDKLRIVVDGIILKQKFHLQENIYDYQIQKKQYFQIDENGHIQSYNDYFIMHNGHIVKELSD